jgi:replication factor A2
MNYGGGYEAYGNEEYGGGGFMDTSNSQYGSQVGTPSKGGSRPRGNRETQTLIPVTIRQLQNVIKSESDDVFRIDNHEVSSVKIIGLLSNVNAHSTNVNFQVNDGTGTIEGRLFLHSEDGEYSENEASRLQ